MPDPIQFSPVRTFAAEGARVGLVVCGECAAAVLLDPGDEFDAPERHREWHEGIESRIAANRPDPRLGFIGG